MIFLFWTEGPKRQSCVCVYSSGFLVMIMSPRFHGGTANIVGKRI